MIPRPIMMNKNVRDQLYKIASLEKGNVRVKKKYVTQNAAQINQKMKTCFYSVVNFNVVRSE